MNILITGHDSFHNKGCQALIFTTTEILKEIFPDATFTVFSWEPEYDQTHYDNPSIKCKFIQHRFQTNEFSLRNKIWLTINNYGIKTERILWVKPSFYDAIKSCDLMVVSGGDVLADYGEVAVKHYFFPIAVAKALKKPVYVFAQSISPYTSKELLRFAQYHLNKVDLITVRERISYEYLKTINTRTPLYLTADPAFLLKPSSEDRLKEILDIEGIHLNSSLTVGISVSETLTRWGGADHTQFLEIMSNVCDTIVQKYNAKMVFISHVAYPDEPHNNDFVVSEKIRNMMKEKDSGFLIKGDYSCRDLKSIISRCDIFIGARTHATIASASQHIPTLALAYSTKAFGIMEDVLDRERCTCNVKGITFQKLFDKASYLIENRKQISESISEKLNAIKERSQMNGYLAQQVFKSNVISKA